MYSGSVAAYAYKELANDGIFDTAVILGPNHTGYGSAVSLWAGGAWRTPFGEARINEELAHSLLGGVIEEDETAHLYEHSIEVQLPWLQYRFNSVNFVPITIGHSNIEMYKDIGSEIKDSIIGNKVVIASSDFTHYGESYGYAPVSGGASKVLSYVEGIDLEAAKAVVDRAPERFLEIVKKYRATIYGRAAIATMLYAVKDRAMQGTILDYSTSYDVSRDTNSLVGYCGIVLE